MVGAAIKGVSKILRKGTKIKRPRGTPTKAGLMARRGMLRGETTAEKYKGTMGGVKQQLKQTKKPSATKAYIEGVATGTGATALTALLLSKKKAKKEAQAKEDKKLKTAMAKKKAEDEKKKKAYGKRAGTRAPKQKVNYGGR